VTRHFDQITDLQPLLGELLGTSDWILVDQARIDAFAEATGDHQWIHTDPARAAQGPFGGTVAHGFLTLSLVSVMFDTAFTITHSRMGLNYGLNRVRFPAPLPAGTRVRGHFKLTAYEPVEGGAQMTIEVTVEAEGQPKPVCVAESVTRRYV
jgi:acyl dehydratase